MKKLFLSISAPILALSPIVAVVACGKTTDVNTTIINKTLASYKDFTSTLDLSTISDQVKLTAKMSEIIANIQSQIEDVDYTDAEEEIIAEAKAADPKKISSELEFVSQDSTNNQIINVRIVFKLNGKEGRKAFKITGTAPVVTDTNQTDVNAVRTQFLSSTLYTSTKDAADLPATSATDATWADVAAFTATTGVTIAGLDFNGATVTYVVTKTPSTTPSESKATLSFTITIKKGDPAKSAIATIEVKSKDTNAVTQGETDAQKVQSIKTTFGTPTGLNNKEINALDGLVTSSENYSPFNNDAITALGITATIPGELKGVILTYKVTELTSPFGAPSTYNLEIKFALNSENQKIDVTLTSSNSNPTAQEALDDVHAAFLLQVVEGKQFMSSKNGADLPADGADLSSTTSFSALSSLLGITIAGDDLAVAPIAVSFTVANATGSTTGEPVNKLTVTISWTITGQTVTAKTSTIVVSSDDLV